MIYRDVSMNIYKNVLMNIQIVKTKCVLVQNLSTYNINVNRRARGR